MKEKDLHIILSGGGTGGHIYPAIAIANEIKLRYPKASILFVGAKDRMEMEKVPQAGYPIKGLWISGIQRKLTLKNVSFPFKLISSLWNAKKIIKQFKPNIAIGTGGFASGPLLMVANSKGIPTLIQEQNSFPGITNKLLSKKTHKICVAYDGLERFFPSEKIIKTGNPVRQDLIKSTASKLEALTHFGLQSDAKTLLVIGGSLGAKAINQFIAQKIPFFKENKVQILWQCGKIYFDTYKNHQTKGVVVKPFINRMDFAYKAADIVISRSGASSVSELCIVGKPVIFIPSPNVAEDHQTKNAKAISDKGGAVLIAQKNLSAHFEKQFLELLLSEEKQQTLSKNIKALALPNATVDIVNEVEKLLINKN